MTATDIPAILLAEPTGFSQQALGILEGFARVTRRPVTEAELTDALREFDIVWLRLGRKIRRDMLGEDIRCSIIACPVTGLDHIDLAISGAALDVLEGEPDASASTLIIYANANDNLLIVPHTGGNTRESFEKTEVFIGDRVQKTWEAG